jgi:hypothetical protein
MGGNTLPVSLPGNFLMKDRETKLIYPVCKKSLYLYGVWYVMQKVLSANRLHIGRLTALRTKVAFKMMIAIFANDGWHSLFLITLPH